MKILLVNPHETNEIKMTKSVEARDNLVPLGLLYIAAALKVEHDVKVVDMALLNLSTSDLPEMLDEFQPDLIGITCVITLWGTALELVQTAKSHAPDVITVVGGPNVSKYPAETLAHKEIDYIIVGSGQKPMLELCRKLERNEDDITIRNCFSNSKVYLDFPVLNTEEYHLDNFSFPDRAALPYKRYHASITAENPTTSMISSMGCPYRCAYCSSRIEQAFQLRKESLVVDEMSEIEQLGIKSTFFQDELFTLTEKRVKTICEDILHRGINLRWMLKARTDSIKPRMIDIMKKAGCMNIHFGIESGNDITLQRMRKGYNANKVKEVISMVKSSGLQCSGNFMLAYPGEQEDDVLRTIEFAASLELDMTHFGITYAIPMTELYYEGVKAGRHSGQDPWAEYTRNPFNQESKNLFKIYASDTFSDEQRNKFLDIAYSSCTTLFDLKKRRNKAVV